MVCTASVYLWFDIFHKAADHSVRLARKNFEIMSVWVRVFQMWRDWLFMSSHGHELRVCLLVYKFFEPNSIFAEQRLSNTLQTAAFGNVGIE